MATANRERRVGTTENGTESSCLEGVKGIQEFDQTPMLRESSKRELAKQRFVTFQVRKCIVEGNFLLSVTNWCHVASVLRALKYVHMTSRNEIAD